jgi:hypothetical protein
MSLIKFNLKEEHLLLLKNLRWSKKENNVLVSLDESEEPVLLMTDNIYEDINVILNGRPKDFNPLEDEKPFECTPLQKAEWNKLLTELPTALEIVLSCQTFTVGKYIANYATRDWEPITS